MNKQIKQDGINGYWKIIVESNLRENIRTIAILTSKNQGIKNDIINCLLEKVLYV